MQNYKKESTMDKDLSENLTATDQSANNDQTSSNNEQSQINQISAELSLAGTDLKKLEMLKHLETRRITPDKNLPPMEFLFIFAA